MWEWLRLRGVAFYRGLPVTGYGLAALGYALVMFVGTSWGHTPSVTTMQFAAFFLLPAVFALSHWLAPRDTRGGKPYWALAGAWSGAVVFGVLAHSPALEPLAPWFSLAGYVCLAVGLLLGVTSLAFGRFCFSAAHPPRLQSAFSRVVGAFEVLAVLAILAIIFALVPYRLVLAPRYPGARMHRLFNAGDSFPYSRLAWSPDSCRLLLGARSGPAGDIALIAPEGSRTTVARNAYLASQPWLSDGTGFLFSRRGEAEGQSEIWYSSVDGREQRRLLQSTKLGSPHCSPTGSRVAYWHDGWAYLAGRDLTSPRRFARCEGIWGWSPDGASLLLSTSVPAPSGRRQDRLRSYLLAPVCGGSPRPLLPQCVNMFPVWLNAQEFVSQQRVGGCLGFLTDSSEVTVWSTEGKRLRAHRYRTGVNLGFDLPWPSPDGRRVATTLAKVAPLTDRLYVLDTVTGQPLSLPAPGLVTDAAWSPDGRKLAVIGYEFHLGDVDSDSYSTSYLALITGL